MDLGWPLYEWRLRTTEFGVPRKHPQPVLADLAEAAGRSVLVHWEQGLGDVIQFCRYVPMLAAAGAKVLFAPQPALRQLFAPLQGPGVTIVDREEPSLPFDRQIALLSLPHLFGTTLDTLEASTPYLCAEPARVAAWRTRLGPDLFKIGICWKGNPTFAGDARRSFALAHFAALASLPGVRLISLHKGEGEAELQALTGDSFRVETFGEGFDAGPGAFLDTAAVMMSLDLVVTSDTSIAHLAGALGVLTRVLLEPVTTPALKEHCLQAVASLACMPEAELSFPAMLGTCLSSKTPGTQRAALNALQLIRERQPGVEGRLAGVDELMAGLASAASSTDAEVSRDAAEALAALQQAE